jgi:hypothetical protein
MSNKNFSEKKISTRAKVKERGLLHLLNVGKRAELTFSKISTAINEKNETKVGIHKPSKLFRKHS